MAVGLPLKTTYANGDVYSASDVNDTNGTINITAAPYAAGKNKIINGDFEVWQRGTTFNGIVGGQYTADRWCGNFINGTINVTRQTFTPGAAPVAGYEGEYFMQLARTSTHASIADYFSQRVEDVRTFAGQTVTISFWAKVASGTPTLGMLVTQSFGSGGSGEVSTSTVDNTLSTSWTRYSATIAVPSVSGKTIGAGSWMSPSFVIPVSAGNLTLQIWGVQMESGSTATPFQTATGTIQGELAACQRYYYRFTSDGDYDVASMGNDAEATTQGTAHIKLPVTMRISPTTVDTGGTWFYSQYAGSAVTLTSLAYRNNTSKDVGVLVVQAASGLSTSVKYSLLSNNSTASFIGFSAEL